MSLLLIGMARGQEEVDVASLNANGDGPLPCWTLVDANFDRKECSSFEGKMLANGSSWAAVTDGVVLTTAVISILRDNAILPDKY